jgi:8-oxo-dGTP pyrophosphatase MutT (NUDIX family)
VSDPSITHLTTIDVQCVERRWPWTDANADAIDAFWKEARTEQPKLFDGPVFVFADARIEGHTFRAVCFESRFSRLLYAKRHGFPDPEVVNGFAMGAVKAADGAFLLGIMGAHTANPGQIYFPAGTPDPTDRQADGSLDLIGSVVRELAEETGLRRSEYEFGKGWVLVRDGGLFAFMRPLTLLHPAAEARSRMLARMQAMEEEELSDIYVARTGADIDRERMPPYVQAFLTWAFAQP